MSREFLAALGVVIGVMLSAWGFFMIYRHFKLPKGVKRIIPMWIVIILTLVGLLEFWGGLRKLLPLLTQ